MAMTELELRRNGHEPFSKRLTKIVAGPFRPIIQPVTSRIAEWRESRDNPEIARELIVPAQPRLLESLDVKGAFRIMQEHVEHPLQWEDFERVLQAASERRIGALARPVEGAQSKIEWRTMNGDEAARKPYAYRSTPKQLERMGIVTGFDSLLSALYENEPGSYRSFYRAVLDGEEIPLWDREGRARYPRRVFREPLSRLEPGQTIPFLNREVTMNATALPLKQDFDMSRFVLAVDNQRAQAFGDTIDEARKNEQALLWLVKSSHFDLLKGVFWENIENIRKEGTDFFGSLLKVPFLRGFRNDESPSYRFFTRDLTGRLYGMDDKLVSGERYVPKEAIRGSVDVIIEPHSGELEKFYVERMAAIAARQNRVALEPFGEDQRVDRILTVGIADITRTGKSLRDIGKVDPSVNSAAVALEIVPAPPILVTFQAKAA